MLLAQVRRLTVRLALKFNNDNYGNYGKSTRVNWPLLKRSNEKIQKRLIYNRTIRQTTEEGITFNSNKSKRIKIIDFQFN